MVGDLPHDRTAFTQGLAFWQGRLFEGTGLDGESLVRELDPGSGREVRRAALDGKYFGEGITIWNGRLYQLTWREHRCLVYDAASSQVLGEPVWFELGSDAAGRGQYRAQGFVWCYDRWIAGDPQAPRLGAMTPAVSGHYGSSVEWEFQTLIVYNGARGAIFHELELIGLPGRAAFGADPSVWTSYTLDGQTWSQERARRVGKQGERAQRLLWSPQGSMRTTRIQRFRGTSDAHLAVSQLEAQIEPLTA